jgi:hypothetical protein
MQQMEKCQAAPALILSEMRRVRDGWMHNSSRPYCTNAPNRPRKQNPDYFTIVNRPRECGWVASEVRIRKVRKKW